MIPPPPRMMTMTISLSLRGLRLIRAREREREREVQENFVKRIKRQPLVSSNGFKRTKYTRRKGHSSFQNYKVYKGSICLLYVCCCCCSSMHLCSVLLLMLFLMLMLLSFVPRARRLRSCQTSLSHKLNFRIIVFVRPFRPNRFSSRHVVYSLFSHHRFHSLCLYHSRSVTYLL